ncbi:MAG TPA: hypothetical protein VLT33_44840 [Labilithrix sp.]|nr:hypothetical protein [Labilithrix sp.]
MVKALAASAFAFTVVCMGGLAAVACSSTGDSTFAEEPPKPLIEPGPISNLVPDDAGGGGDGGGGEAGPASCPPAIPAAFAPTWTAPTKKSACTTEELKGYYDACLANAGQTEGDGTCKKFKAAHADCGTCAEPDDGSGPIQWHVSRKFYTINVAGCIAVTQDAPEAGKCGDAYNAAVQCSRESCESCFAIGGTFTQFRDCQKSVQGTGICKSYETTQAAACTGYKNAGSPALACFNSGTEAQEIHFTRVISLLCGP